MTGGFATIEALVSLALLASVSLALSNTLIAAGRARTRIERGASAVRLAEDGLERIRAGGRDGCVLGDPRYRCASTIETWSEELNLDHARLVVQSLDDPAIEVELETLVRR